MELETICPDFIGTGQRRRAPEKYDRSYMNWKGMDDVVTTEKDSEIRHSIKGNPQWPECEWFT